MLVLWNSILTSLLSVSKSLQTEKANLRICDFFIWIILNKIRKFHDKFGDFTKEAKQLLLRLLILRLVTLITVKFSFSISSKKRLTIWKHHIIVALLHRNNILCTIYPETGPISYPVSILESIKLRKKIGLIQENQHSWNPI